MDSQDTKDKPDKVPNDVQLQKGKQALKVFAQLVNQKQPLERYWTTAYAYTLPHRGQYFQNKGAGTEGIIKAQSDQQVIYDSTAGDAISLLAASIMSGLTPSASQWFQFRIPGVKFDDLQYDARVWLENASKTLFNLIHNSSNYNATALEALEDLAISGMYGIYIEKEDGGDFHFELWPLDSLYVQENPKTQVIDTVYRICLYTAEAAVEKFGEENVPEFIETAYENNSDDPRQYEFLHIIKPRKGKPGKFATQLPFESLYVCKKSGQVVKESGYHELPIVVPRWSKIPRTSYALGPLNKALPDIKTLNKVVEMMLQNAEMAIAGTFVAKADGYLNPNTTKIGPRRVVFAQDPGNIRPLTIGGDFRIAFEEITRLQKQIKSVLMADELEPIQKNYASATEVSTRAVIVRQILGPIFARLQSEYLEPLIGRCFGLAFRDGTFGQIPQSLQGSITIIPEYVSPMARAQRMEEVTSMEKFEQSLAATAQLNPHVLDVYDFDLATLKKAGLIGVPSDVIRSKEQIRKVRDDQAQAQQEQQAQQQAQTNQQQVMNPGVLKAGMEAMGGPEAVQQLIKGQS